MLDSEDLCHSTRRQNRLLSRLKLKSKALQTNMTRKKTNLFRCPPEDETGFSQRIQQFSREKKKKKQRSNFNAEFEKLRFGMNRRIGSQKKETRSGEENPKKGKKINSETWIVPLPN